VEVVDHGGAAQAGQVLAGAAVAGTAALPVPDVGERVLDPGAFAGLCTVLPVRRPWSPGRAGQLSGSEIEGEVGLAVVAGGVAHPSRLAVDGQIIAALADQGQGQAGRPVRSSGKVNPAAA
jgi:hypothetical protein